MNNSNTNSKTLQQFPKKITLFSESNAGDLQHCLSQVIQSIKEDYFASLPQERFLKEYIFHESVVMKCAAYRFASAKLWDDLKSAVTDNLLLEGIEEKLLCHPIFYVRQSTPDINHSSQQKVAFLDSQPHYDRSFDLYAHSFWLALEDIDSDTGGLCFFHDNESIKRWFEVPWGTKNTYNYDKYLKHHDKMDVALEKHCIPPRLKCGEAYWFDSNTLHAATKSIRRTRISFDFRFICKSQFDAASHAQKKTVIAFNKDIDLSNALNLVTLGDLIGAKRIYPSIQNLIPTEHVAYNIRIPNQKFSWRDEYRWVEVPEISTQLLKD